MKKILLLSILLVGVCAFALAPEDSFLRNVTTRLVDWVNRSPQEKVYLHTDRDHYDAGEKVWFRAYLVNATTHQLSNLSRFVYVELRDRQDSLYTRVKIPFRKSVFAGYVDLPDKLPQGDYFLRAYSYWMQNAGDDFIFRKKIRVFNPQSSKVRADITWEKTEKAYAANLRLHNSRNEPYDKVFVEYIQGDKLKIARTDDEGNFQIKLDSTNFGKEVVLRFKEEDPFEYEETVYLPDPRSDFEVAFMPEGGHLLAGCQQTVAFKSIGTDGLSREVSGVIMNDRGEQVNYAQTTYKGMGAFELEVKPGERYYALLAMKDGEQKRFDLPEPVTRGVGLKLTVLRDWVGFSVLAAESTPKMENLYILVHSRGVPLFCQPVQMGANGRFFQEQLPEGIVHFLLVDDKNNVYSERLCFIRKKEPAEIVLTADKAGYYIREQVKLDMRVRADSLQSVEGSFSVSVTDDGQIERDTLQDHILSYLLLTSDLKGYVEDPAFYFRDTRRGTLNLLDMLMLTQGWSRFEVPKVLRAEYDTMAYYMERGQAISGRVKNFWGKDAGMANLFLLSNTGIFQMVNADSSGYFVIDGIAFPDSTKFMLQGKSKKGRRSVEVLVDSDEFMEPSVKMPHSVARQAEEDEFYKRYTKDYYYDENGVKVYVLDEAIVKRKAIRKRYSFYDNLADYTLDSAKLATMGDWDMQRVLQEFPGVEAYGDSVRRFGKTILLLVNDFEEDYDMVKLLMPRDLVSINFIMPPRSYAFWGSAGENGVIVITTNPHFVRPEIPRPNMVTFSLLGYQKRAEFYMPHYEVDSVRIALVDSIDRRKTIYWNPAVKTDQEGKANFAFSASDSFGPYTVVIEGILNDGRVCRKVKKITLKPL